MIGERIQRRRSKGWRMPPNTVYVDRPSKWGNPFKIGAHGGREEVLRKYRTWLMQKLATSTGLEGLRTQPVSA